MYHSTALLLPDCRVMVAGSDVTYDGTAEIFSPPYLSLGPRPALTTAPAAIRPGDELRLGYTSSDLVNRVLLLRTGAFTHSMPFGEQWEGAWHKKNRQLHRSAQLCHHLHARLRQP